MRITGKQLRQIIREELMREMPVGIPRMMGFARDRLRRRSAVPVKPPNLRLFEVMGEACGTCVNFCPESGTCKAFGGYSVSADQVCNVWTPKP